jgi:hypothetical protein
MGRSCRQQKQRALDNGGLSIRGQLSKSNGSLDFQLPVRQIRVSSLAGCHLPGILLMNVNIMSFWR